MRRNYATILALLAFAFFLRVLGQALVAWWDVEFLPPMTQWYSGLLPYPVLLPIQVVILLVQGKVSVDLWRGRGLFSLQRPRLGTVLRRFSYVYVAVMVFRYILTMSLHPDRRWFGGTIPIVFHCVLAAYLYVWGRFQTAGDELEPQRHRPRSG